MPELQSCPEVQKRQRSAEPTGTRHDWVFAPPGVFAAWQVSPAAQVAPPAQSVVQMKLLVAVAPRHFSPPVQFESEVQGRPCVPVPAPVDG
jgi:hypothetical protein